MQLHSYWIRLLPSPAIMTEIGERELHTPIELLGSKKWIAHNNLGDAKTHGSDVMRGSSLARLFHGLHHIKNACILPAAEIVGE